METHYKALSKKDMEILYTEEWSMIFKAIETIPNEREKSYDARVIAVLKEKMPALGTVTLAFIYLKTYHDECLEYLQKRLQYPEEHSMSLSTLFFIYDIPLVEQWLGKCSTKNLIYRIVRSAQNVSMALLEEYFDFYKNPYIFYRIAEQHPEKERILAFLHKNR